MPQRLDAKQLAKPSTVRTLGGGRQPRNQAAAESDVERGVREFSLSIFFYVFLSKPISEL
jgi:hypothetical protein